MPNRGNATLARVSNDPGVLADYLKRGHVLLTSGWQGDLAPRDGIETISVPVAKNPDGSSLTGPVLAQFGNMPPDTNTLPIVAGGSNHNWPVYPNLAGELVLTGLDQLWGADITYIRLEVEFVYLAVVLDAFSRRMLGWALERTLPDDLSLAALRMALRARSPAPGLIHHSDQGVQYSSGDYTDALKEHQI